VASTGVDIGRFIQSLSYQDESVTAITSNLPLVAAPSDVARAADSAALDRDSVVKVSQVVTLDKDDQSKRLGSLDEVMNEQGTRRQLPRHDRW
jgi:mRNA-degrading endonuclease toxin of MazEF toxin-antitoxin module